MSVSSALESNVSRLEHDFRKDLMVLSGKKISSDAENLHQ